MLEICINTETTIPLYQQIVEQVKRLVDDRQLRPGEQIPAVRELARWLQINPSTVARAYFDLKREGIVATSRRRGTIILGNADNLQKTPLHENRFLKTVDNHLWKTLNQESNQEELEATFALHLAHWRVQKQAQEIQI